MNQLFYNIASGNAEIVVFRKVPQFYFASVETVNYKQLRISAQLIQNSVTGYHKNQERTRKKNEKEKKKEQ